MTAKPAPRRWLMKLSLLAVSGLLALAVLELAARVLFPDWAPRTGRLTEFWRFDSDLGWAHVPNARGTFRTYGFDVDVKISSQGWRGPEFSPEPAPGIPRIAVIGDSYVWGFGVEQEQIFTSRIAEACRGVEVLNLGVSGYSTDQELLLWRLRARDYRPDVVILVVAGNDYESNVREKEYVYYYKPLFVLQGDRLVLTQHPVPRENVFLRIAASAAKRSFLLNQTNRTLALLRSRLRSRPPAATSGAEAVAPRPFPATDEERVTVRLVQEFVAAVEQAGARAVVVLTDRQKRELGELVGSPSVPVVYLDDVLPPEDYDRYHLPRDFHWTAEGHRVVGNAVREALLEAHLLSPEQCYPSAAR